jgi:hypothetical protein
MTSLLEKNDQWGEFAKKKIPDPELKAGAKIIKTVLEVSTDLDQEFNNMDYVSILKEARENFDYNIDKLIGFLNDPS